MLMVFFIGLICLALLVLLTLVSWAISEHSLVSREELSSYECGFEHNSLSRLPISLRYFMLTVVFLVFDMEIMLLSYYPLFCFSVGFGLLSFFVFSFFVLILVLGLAFEWLDGALDWVM